MELIVPEDYIAELNRIIARIDTLGPRLMVAMLEGKQLKELGQPLDVALHLAQLKKNIARAKEKVEAEGVAFMQFTALTARLKETDPVLDIVEGDLVLAGY